MDPLTLLIRAAVAGDEKAWTELAGQLIPNIRSIAGSHEALRSRRLADSPDELAEVVTACLERLAADGKRNLQRYLTQAEQPGTSRVQSFDSWLYGAVDFTIRDHLRRRYGRAPKDTSAPTPSKRALVSGAARLDDDQLQQTLRRELGLTTQLAVAEIFAWIEASFSPDESRALRLYYFEDMRFSELAAELGLADSAEAERLIRKLNARLRARFAGG